MIVTDEHVADASEKVMVPKFQVEPSSSMIHSALTICRAFDSLLNVCDADCPVVRFSTRAVPAVVDVVVTVRRTVSPTLTSIPLSSYLFW